MLKLKEYQGAYEHLSISEFTCLCHLVSSTALVFGLQCFDAVGWAAGKASGL